MKDFQQITPVPVDQEDPGSKMNHYKYGKPTKFWAYKDAQGKLLFYIRRWDFHDGTKDIRPLSYGTLNGDVGWHHKLAVKPRPLFGLEKLAHRPDARVLIAEGEKASDAAQKLFPHALCITWPGGTSSVKHVDWSPLKGRSVLIWPDNDQAGFKAAAEIRDQISDIIKQLIIIRPPSSEKKGWDAADFSGTPEDAEKWIRARIDELKENPWDPLSEIDEKERSVDTLSSLGGDIQIFSEQKSYIEHLTEDAAALNFVEHCDGKILYCHTKRAWYIWNKKYWELDQTELVLNLVRTFCRTQDLGPRKKYGKLSFSKNVENFVRNDRRTAVTSEIWDSDPWALGTPDGLVDLKTGKFFGPDKEAYNTKITSVAPSDTSGCPAFMKFLDETTNGDKGLQRFLQQVAGYCLTGQINEHCLFFIYGGGCNGKSVFLNVLSDILGAYAVTAPMSTFTNNKNDSHPTDVAMLYGARLVTVSETEAGKTIAEAKIKSMTGGDKLTARFMRQDFFTFMPQFKVIMVGNHQPELVNVDEAMKRRLHIIPFIHKPINPDPDLPDKLKKEYSAILQWMIEGCNDWRENGFMMPAVVINATSTYFSEQDMIGQWTEDICEVGPLEWESVDKLYQTWEKYQKQNGENPGTKKAFGQALKRLGYQAQRRSINGKGMRGYEGIAIHFKPENSGIFQE